MKIDALCWTCAHRHAIDFDPIVGPGAAFSDWTVKHPPEQGHDIDFVWPQRSQKARQSRGSYAGLLHNANIKVAYAATTTPTLTLASLAASSTLLAGRESTAISNASNLYLDYHIAGNFKTAASNHQVGKIQVALVGARDDTPTWPDVFDGTDSTETVSQAEIYNSVCKLAAVMATIASASITYSFGPSSVAARFGGFLPVQFVIFVSHSSETSTNAWSATEGDHAVRLTGLYATSI